MKGPSTNFGVIGKTKLTNNNLISHRPSPGWPCRHLQKLGIKISYLKFVIFLHTQYFQLNFSLHPIYNFVTELFGFHFFCQYIIGLNGEGHTEEWEIGKGKFFLCKLVGCPSKAPPCQQGNYSRVKSRGTFCVAAKFVIDDLKPVDQLQCIEMWLNILNLVRYIAIDTFVKGFQFYIKMWTLKSI